MRPAWFTVMIVALASAFIAFTIGVSLGESNRFVPKRWVQCSGYVDDRTFLGWCGEIVGYWVLPARPPERGAR